MKLRIIGLICLFLVLGFIYAVTDGGNSNAPKSTSSQRAAPANDPMSNALKGLNK